MSVEVTESTVRQCPSCAGPLEEMQTICTQCRADLEAQVFAVSADSYIPPKGAPGRKKSAVSVEADANAAIASAADIDVASKPDRETPEPDLLPLAPADDEPTRRSAPAELPIEEEKRPPTRVSPVAPVTPVAPDASTTIIDTAPRPGPATHSARTSATAAHNRPNALSLQTSSRWKHIGIAVGALAVAGGLGVAIWSFIIPNTAVDDDTTQPTVPLRQMKPPAAPVTAAPANPVEAIEVIAPPRQPGTVTLPTNPAPVAAPPAPAEHDTAVPSTPAPALAPAAKPAAKSAATLPSHRIRPATRPAAAHPVPAP